MSRIKYTFWAFIALITILWIAAEQTSLLEAGTLMQFRRPLVQLTGLLAVGCMSFAMVLSLRPLWPERWLNGLDKMYRLHKWLGISSLVFAIIHWLWAKGPKWATQWGLLEPRQRGPRGGAGGEQVQTLETFLRSMRGTAESVGEWAFYAAAILIALALIKRFPYRPFRKTHWILAAIFLVFIFHAAVLIQFPYWSQPIGWFAMALLVVGGWSAFVVLLGRSGKSQQVSGQIKEINAYPGVKSLAITFDVPKGWKGHKPGQFAFITFDKSEGHHPFTIASAWNPQEHSIRFLAKELGDYTDTLDENISVGQTARIEGPYGQFNFEDDKKSQIWIGGGIGITPFIAKMNQLAHDRQRKPLAEAEDIYLFHSTQDIDERALERLRADAEAAGVNLHITIDSRDGYLNIDKIRENVPDWLQTSIWFCGPSGFANAIKLGAVQHGFPVKAHFHQEFFEMR